MIFLRLGLLLGIAAAFTIRYYYYEIALEFILIIGGTILLSVSCYLSGCLKTPRHGFTDQELSGVGLMDHLKIESLIISETTSGIGNAREGTGTPMGGGKFGGGGASGDF